jgi:hypothetical protein
MNNNDGFVGPVLDDLIPGIEERLKIPLRGLAILVAFDGVLTTRQFRAPTVIH